MHDYKQTKGHFWIFAVIVLLIGVFLIAHLFINRETNISIEDAMHVLKNDEDYAYFYEQCSQEEQDIYLRIYYTFYHFDESVVLQSSDFKKVKDIFYKVMYDHPEFYYVNDQFEYMSRSRSIELYPIYDYSKDEVKDLNQQIANNIDSLCHDVQKENDKVQKIKLIYDYLIENVQYQENKKTDQNIISSLIEKKSVCAGYARAYQYLLNRSGVQSVYIVGDALTNESQLEKEAHAWVMIHIDNDFYYSDVTWGDVEDKDIQHACYGYMLMTSDEMRRCYKPDVKYERTIRGSFNYFKNEGFYLKHFDEDKISLAVQKSLKENRRVAEFQCANETVYNEVKDKIENSYLGYRILSQNGCWSDVASYYCDDRLLMIEIHY